MIKRFFVVFALCFLVLSSQIVSASDVDWDSVKKISSKAELAKYIENGRRRGQKVFNFVLTNFKLSTDREIANKERDMLLNEYCYSFAFAPSVSLNGVMGTGQLTYTIITEYPGTNVANAYLGYISWLELTYKEQELYRVAVKIVDEASKRSSEVEKARYIHDEICRLANLPEDNSNDIDKTATGALIKKVTNCQGYADAFYMLGRMSGLNTSRIGGKTDNGNTAHAWNTITLADGKTYCVDVYFDDKFNSDYWFLATFERMKATHSCEWEIIPNLQ